MICFPNAKINIGLNITEKRSDGFHTIESVMYPLKGIMQDALEIIARPSLTPTLSSGEGEKAIQLFSSGIKIPGKSEGNLCVKAYHLIKKDYPQVPSIEIYLHKAIPIGAGLGGGSADAAFFIRLLNDAFELGISWGEMHHYAKQLGSDCSFFVSNRPAFAEGKGDQLESINLNLSGYFIAVVYPDIHINTAEAYSMVKLTPRPKGGNAQSPFRDLGQMVTELPITKWNEFIHNDFEDSAFQKYPELEKIKEKLYSKGAVYASMSGSGSAVYGIFKKYTKMKKEFAKYQVWEGSLT